VEKVEIKKDKKAGKDHSRRQEEVGLTCKDCYEISKDRGQLRSNDIVRCETSRMDAGIANNH